MRRQLMSSGPCIAAAAVVVVLGSLAATPAAVAGPAATGLISTVAGGLGEGAGTSVAQQPSGVVVDPATGGLYVTDVARSVVRLVQPVTGVEQTVAGNGTVGFSGDSGPAAAAQLSSPQGVALDGHGNVVIADTGNGLVRVVAAASGTFYGQSMTAGDIYAVAHLDRPWGVTVDASGNLVIADNGANEVEVLATASGMFYGQSMVAGQLYDVAGDGTAGYSGDGAAATSAELSIESGVVVDPAGNLVVADTANSRVRVVAVATGTFYGRSMSAGDIYTVAGNGAPGDTGDGGPATSAALYTPSGVVLDGFGNVIISDSGTSVVRLVAATTGTMYGQAMTAQDIYTVAGSGDSGLGDGGPATGAELSSPEGVAVDANGNLLIIDYGQFRVRAVAASTAAFYGVAMTDGDIYTVAGNGTSGYSGDGGSATDAELASPDAVALDPHGNQVVVDTASDVIRLAAVASGTFYGQSMTAGDIYTVAGTGRAGYSGDGGAATAASLSDPHGAAVDAKDNLVFADGGNNRIRVVAATNGTFYGQAMVAGDIYTVAGRGKSGFSGDRGPATAAKLFQPYAVAFDSHKNLVIADDGNNRIRVVAKATGVFYGQSMTAGDIYTVAGDGIAGVSGDGGPATAARLSCPEGLAVDRHGNLAFTGYCLDDIRVVAAQTGAFYGQPMTAGDIYRVAAAHDGLRGPSGIAIDPHGNLVVADSLGNMVRVLAAETGTFYGQPMVSGSLYTVAGNGTPGYSGDGGAATSAELDRCAGIAVDPAGDLFIGDSNSGRIREVGA